MSSKKIIILGAGLAGLSSGYVLAKAGQRVVVYEGDHVVGGLSKTVTHHGFRFDLGGHRFLTKNKKIEQMVLRLLQDEALVVHRKSQIYMSNKYFDYPLKPLNAVFGFGLLTSLEIILDYWKERLKNIVQPTKIVSLEDWVVNQFGRRMFDLYFKEYSEKVWGLRCERICKEWVAQRIKGLSLGQAVRDSLLHFRRKQSLTLYDTFIYPRHGIGELSERLRREIEIENSVCTNTRIVGIHHDNSRITHIVTDHGGSVDPVVGDHFISSLPLTSLVRMLEPAAPADILLAASRLRYRDLVLVTIMLDRERVTDLTWLYLPQKDIPLGRIHEPKNWSPDMAPAGKTHIVAEFFCFKDDATWQKDDDELIALTVHHMEKLSFIRKEEVLDGCVLRIPKAYPIFEIGYQQHYTLIEDYLRRFDNLSLIGRGGKFKYYNMDHAMESGIDTAERILEKRPDAAAAAPSCQDWTP